MSSTGEDCPNSGDTADAQDGSGNPAAAHSDDTAQDTTDMGYMFMRCVSAQQKKLMKHPQDQIDEASNNPLPKYNMNNTRRGYCLIFNQMEFAKSTGLETREGSDVDAKALEAAFGKLGFKVKTFTNSTSAEFGQVLVQYSREKDHSDCDCFALVLLSHGSGEEFHVFDKTLPIDTVIKKFRPDVCKTLVGKPKLFFIQACRGETYMESCEVPDGPTDKVDPISGPKAQLGSLRIPLEADFCVFYSTPPGYYSFRNKQKGSWFVQQLTAVLNEHGNSLEFQHTMLFVQHLVAIVHESDTGKPATTGKKQMPVVVSQLRKLLYFRDK